MSEKKNSYPTLKEKAEEDGWSSPSRPSLCSKSDWCMDEVVEKLIDWSNTISSKEGDKPDLKTEFRERDYLSRPASLLLWQYVRNNPAYIEDFDRYFYVLETMDTDIEDTEILKALGISFDEWRDLENREEFIGKYVNSLCAKWAIYPDIISPKINCPFTMNDEFMFCRRFVWGEGKNDTHARLVEIPFLATGARAWWESPNNPEINIVKKKTYGAKGGNSLEKQLFDEFIETRFGIPRSDYVEVNNLSSLIDKLYCWSKNEELKDAETRGEKIKIVNIRHEFHQKFQRTLQGSQFHKMTRGFQKIAQKAPWNIIIKYSKA